MTQREALMATVGQEIVRFQDASYALDEAAATALALGRPDLQCLSLLLFMGAAPVAQLAAATSVSARTLSEMVGRLELAGYVRVLHAHDERRVEVTEHARAWVATLWGPLEQEATRLLGQQSVRDLQVLARFLTTIRPVHEAHAARIKALLEVPASRPRSNRRRGGLSPAALRRVQLFVEAHLERPLHLRDLAERGGLSEFHFARAFKTSMGSTPRAFIEQRRVEKAQTLLRSSALPLAEVAAQTGLGTQSHFTTTFRRATGFTPARYRGLDSRG